MTGADHGGELPVELDLDDDTLRRRRSAKWLAAGPDEIPAWVAETDFAPCPAVTDALADAVARGAFGYPGPDGAHETPAATAEYCLREWGWPVDPADVVLVGDVMAGIRLTLESLCDEGPVVVPTPCYPPFLDVVPLSGRRLVTVPLDPDGPATLDLDRIDAVLGDGARTVLLCQPHNPWGRVFTAEELTGLRDVVERHGARVVSDEIHAPLTLHGHRHVPYASLPGTAEHTTTVLSASKAFDVPGLKCAQLVTGSAADRRALRARPTVANHGVSSLGPVAATAAWRHGGPWLNAVRQRIEAQDRLLDDLLGAHLPGVRRRRLEATYLAWLDVRRGGMDHPAAVARSRGGVMVNAGDPFGPGGSGHVRVNLATSPHRLTRVVRGLAQAWAGTGLTG